MDAAVHESRNASRIRMRCWGDFALSNSESSADLRPRGRKARALVAYLAMHPAIPVSRERLMGLLWGERAEEQARASLRQALQELKPLANGLGLVAIERDSVTLDAAALTSDLDLLSAAAARHAWPELIALLPEPHERLFADLEGLDSGFDDWLAIERARQANALVSLLADAQAEAHRSGAQREARLLATRLRERDPDASVAAPLPAPISATPPPANADPEAAAPAKPPTNRRRMAAIASVALLAAAGTAALGAYGLGSPPAPVQSSALQTSGEVHSLYLRARAKMRERNPKAAEEVRDLLERAVALDGNYAPVLASMSQQMFLTASAAGADAPRVRQEATALARRALELAPDLADAHAAMALTMHFEGEPGLRHMLRAVELDPSSQDYVYWLGHAYSNALDFPRALVAYKQAYELDPTWLTGAKHLIEQAWSIGRRDDAVAYLRRLEREASPYEANLVRGSLAVQSGDLSQAAEAFAAAQDATEDLGKEAVAVGNRAVLLLSLGYVEAALGKFAECRWKWAQGRSSSLPMPEFFAAHLALQRGTLPSSLRIAELNRSPRDHNARVFVREAAAKLIALGRANELVALYEGSDGLLGFSASSPLSASPQHMARYAPTVAAVLRAAGREGDARRLLVEADRQIVLALRRSNGEAPADVWAAAAKTWAMLGKQADALAALERAVRNGWINIDSLAQDLPDDIADEPGFAPLRGHPRFQAMRAGLNERLAREQAELRPRV